jgi:hypothetical protein
MNSPQTPSGQPSPETAETLTPALAWGKSGRPVFPCWPVHPVTKVCCCAAGDKCKRKHPVLTGGHNAASTNPQDIFLLWTAARDYMRKIARKARGESWCPDPAVGGSTVGLIIFDMDRPEALERFAAIAGEDGMALAHVVLSGLMDDGVNRGAHATYRIPANLDPDVLKRLTIWSVGDGLDGRTNGKGFTILPPSAHRTGVAYEVAQDRDPGECPPQLLELALAQIDRQSNEKKDAKRTGEAPVIYRGPPPARGTWLWKAGCGEDLLWCDRDKYHTELVERALDVLDPERSQGLTNRPSLSYDMWRDIMWSLRAWENYWFDGYAERIAFEWSRQFASHNEAEVRETVWNYHGKKEVGRGRLFYWADKIMLGWRQLFDNAVRGAYAQAAGSMPEHPASVTPNDVPHPGAAPGVLPPSAGRPINSYPLPSICAGLIIWPLAHRDGSALADVRNIELAFRQWGVTLAYDHFTRKKWAFFRDGSKTVVNDGFISTVHTCIGKAGMRIGLSEFKNHLNGLAWQIEFDMALDFLKIIPAWNGVELAARLFVHVFGCPDDEYHRAVGRLFAASLVRRILQPGYKSDHMIVLKSDEGLGKSRFFSKIVPYEFFSENLTFAMDEKKIIEQTAGAILCETPELINITRQQVEHCKHLISRRIDRSRMAYGHETEDVPRRFTMVGSTNDAKPLQSRTGNRRFIIVNIHQQANIGWLEENFSQLWAEFIQIEQSYGPALELPRGLHQEAAAKQEASVDYGPSEEALADAIAEIKEGFISHRELYRFLGFKDHREAEQSAKTMRMAKAAFSRAGWRSHRRNTARGHAIGNTLVNYVCDAPFGDPLSARFIVGNGDQDRSIAEDPGALPLPPVKNGHALGAQPVLKDSLPTGPRPTRFKSRINGQTPL